MGSCFWDFPAAFLDRLAISDPENGVRFSYRDLDALAEEWRGQLMDLAPSGMDVLVALEFETSVDAIAAYLGALRAGWPLLVVEPGQMEPGGHIPDTYRPDIVLSRRDGSFAARLAAQACQGTAAHPDLALLLSTSGSTGDPKLVRLSAGNIDSNARSIAQYLSITGHDRAISSLPLFYSYGLSVLNSYLAAGAGLILTSTSVVDPEFWAIFRQEGATSLAFVPHQFELLGRSGFTGQDLPSLRYITQAGGRLSPELVRRFNDFGKAANWQLYIMYGQTEAAPRISYVPPEALPDAADTIGRPIPGGRLRLLREDGTEITAPGIAGELVYEGPNVMMGYALSREDLARPPETPVLRTGDVAELTGEGFYRITGRLKRFVKLFGLRLSLDQIEALLRGQGVEAHAVACQEQLVLMLPDFTQQAQAQEAVSREYELPRAVIHTAALEELPLLSSGKVDHRSLGRMAAAALEKITAAPSPSIGLAALLMQATRAKSVGPNDSFTSLGGDSLGYLQVQMGLESLYGHAPEGWENMPLSRLEALGVKEAGGLRPVGVDVILRVLAISLVVSQHASDLPLYGGTWMLILLMGYSAGRFQTVTLLSGAGLKLARQMLYPVLLFYFLLVVVYALAPRDQVPISYFLLLGNYHIHDGGWILGVYWFISLYAQLVAFLVLLAWIPTTRCWLGRDAWKTTALGSLGFAVLTGTIVFGLGNVSGEMSIAQWPVEHYAARGFLECLPIFLLGWAIQSATGAARRGLTLLLGLIVVVVFAGTNPSTGPVFWLAATILALALGKPVPVPALIAKGLQMLAAASLFIYMMHPFVVHVFVYATSFGESVPTVVTIVVVLLLSYTTSLGAKWLFDMLDTRLRNLPQRDSAVSGVKAG